VLVRVRPGAPILYFCSVRDSKPHVAGNAYSTPCTGTTTSPNAVIQRLCRITGADEFVELKYLKAPRI
jgi:hypothetical protein